MTTPETSYFGLTRVGEGETLAKNSHAALDSDRVLLDVVLNALLNHDHSAEVALGSPTVAPTAVANASGGALAPSTTYYYKYSYVDQYGLETAASPEVSVTTAAGANGPSAPTLSHEATGGTLDVGTYRYLITFADTAGNETTPSDSADIGLTSAICNGTSRILLTFPSPPLAAPCINVYRQKPGQNTFYFLKKTTNSTYYDDGSDSEDLSRGVPTTNTVGFTNSVTITLPESVPADATGWRLYRSRSPGGYTNTSLVKKVVEGATPQSTTILNQTTDVGGSLLRGFPRSKTTTLSGGAPLDLSNLGGTLPLSILPRGASSMDVFCAGTLEHSKVYAKTELARTIRPLKVTAFFQDLPSGLGGATPHTVTFRFSDGSNNVDLVCSDDTGYYTLEYPTDVGDSYEVEASTARHPFSPTVADSGASNGQAVQLDDTGEYVTVDLGVLEIGTWEVTTRARAESTPLASDLRVQIVETGGTPIIIVDETFTATATFADYVSTTFESDGTSSYQVTIRRDVVGASTLHIDTVTYASTTPTLTGTLTMSVLLANAPATPVPGGNVQVRMVY